MTTIWSKRLQIQSVLGNGNIDFSFLVIFCLPLLLIIMTYDIGGLEKDERFERLIEFSLVRGRVGLQSDLHFMLVCLSLRLQY